jgi:Tol biopolymer transport system component
MNPLNGPSGKPRFFRDEGKLLVSVLAVGVFCWAASGGERGNDPGVQALAKEVHAKGAIVFGAQTGGDWDLFIMRPDGTELRNITHTLEFNEGLPRFSPDGSKLLYRRLPRGDRFDNNRHGIQGALVIAKSDGTDPVVFGKEGEYPWASWSPDGQAIACLAPRGISFIDLATKKVTRQIDRKGFFQQLTWSPDGKWLSGVANSFGTGWSVARMAVETGEVNAVSKVDCCTPDWFPGSDRLIYSGRPGQWTQLWTADGEGRQRTLVYAEDGRHVYGGCVSPDGRYVLFTGNKEEDGDPRNAGAPMGLMRLQDAPIIGGDSASLRQQYPGAKRGPVLTLPSGWEPHWTMTH